MGKMMLFSLYTYEIVHYIFRILLLNLIFQ